MKRFNHARVDVTVNVPGIENILYIKFIK